jgi:Icc-related predicted phosphoesterase
MAGILNWLKRTAAEEGTVVFYASDFHGSTITFKKFLNAPKHYGSKGHPIDVLVCGGDLSGKLIAPIVERNGEYRSYLAGETRKMSTEEELEALIRDCEILGYYSHVFTPEEYEEFKSSTEAQDELFKELILERLRHWVALAEERLGDRDVSLYLMPGNDDIPEVDGILDSSDIVVNADNRVIRISDEHEMLSVGYANITPFDCPRDVPEATIKEQIDVLASQVQDMETCIFNLHCPPLGTQIDKAPQLDDELRPRIGMQGVEMESVGCIAVREAIEEYQPLLGLHGHIHESKGVERIGRTLCVNPSSEYSEGVLRGALVTLRGDRVISHQFTSG